MDTNSPNTHGHGHGDDTSGYVNPEAIQRGHEEDKVDARSIMAVPVAIIATFVLAYVVVTVLINYLRSPSSEPAANPMAAKRNEAPINDRFERIGPYRLEGLQLVEGSDTPFWRTMTPSQAGNSRWFHPEDMRVNSSYGKELGLQDYAWVDKKDKTVRLPVEEAMKIVLSLKDPKNPSAAFLPIADKPIPRNEVTSRARPSNPQFSAAGHGHDQGHGKDKKDNDPDHGEPKKPMENKN